jgi:L-rhamnose isomerase/sugar isomerase
MVHRMTGIARSVAVHIPWDKPEDGDYTGMCQYAEQQGIAIGAVNPNVFQDDQYRLGSLGNPDKSIQESALDHMLECCDIMTKVKSTAFESVVCRWHQLRRPRQSAWAQTTLRRRVDAGLQAVAGERAHVDRIQVF